jgi:hypothetical protein
MSGGGDAAALQEFREWRTWCLGRQFPLAAPLQNLATSKQRHESPQERFLRNSQFLATRNSNPADGWRSKDFGYMASPVNKDNAMRSRHRAMWDWLKTRGQSLDRKFANMHTNTPQSQSTTRIRLVYSAAKKPGKSHPTYHWFAWE